MFKVRWRILTFSLATSLLLSISLSVIHFVPDGDLVNGPIVWHEIRIYGLSALSQWNPTVDNWYFSAYPLNFLIYSLFGNYSEWSIIAVQTIQLMMIAFIAALIVRKMTSGSCLSWLIMPLICGLGAYTWRHGLIAHPFSHNITNLYGLLCCYIFMTNKSRSISYKDVLIGVLSIIASVSDPWFLASYYLPLLIAYIFSVAFTRERGALSALPFIISGIILFSHVIEKTLGLPVAEFHIGNFENWVSNLNWLFIGIGGMLNLFFVEGSAKQYHLFYYLSFAIIFLLLVLSIVKKSKYSSYDLLFLMSVCGISSSFIISDTEWKYYSARFLINVVFIGLIYIVAFSVNNKSRLSVLFLGVLFCSGMYSHYNSYMGKAVPTSSRILSFMKQHDLKYGFGSYWATGSIAVNWLSKSEYVIRPVTFDPTYGYMIYPGRSQTFNFWYNPENNDAIKRQFIAITDGINSEGCRDKNLCTSAVIKQFGSPDETLTMGNMTFLIYNSPILSKKYPYIGGCGKLTFGYSNPSYNRFHWSGWTRPGKNDVWTEGEAAELLFSLPEKFNQSVITVSGESRLRLEVDLSGRNSEMQTFHIKPGKFEITYKIGRKDVVDGKARIEMKTKGVKSPKELGLNNDERKLGLHVHSISYSTR